MLLWSSWPGQSLGEPQHQGEGSTEVRWLAGALSPCGLGQPHRDSKGLRTPRRQGAPLMASWHPWHPPAQHLADFAVLRGWQRVPLRVAYYLSHPWPSPSGHVLWPLLGLALSRGSSHLCPGNPPLTWADQAPFSVTLYSHTQVRHLPSPAINRLFTCTATCTTLWLLQARVDLSITMNRVPALCQVHPHAPCNTQMSQGLGHK